METTMRCVPSILLAGALALGCSDSTAPTVQEVARTYAAAGTNPADRRGSLTTTDVATGQTVDWLAQGATITLTLRIDGTTTGHIFVPIPASMDGPLDADLTGTWTLDGSTVQLSHPADTFLRDMPLQVNGSSLVGDATFAGQRVRVRVDPAPTLL